MLPPVGIEPRPLTTAHPPATHAPLPRMPHCHACPPAMHASPPHACLPAMYAPAMHAPLPCTPTATHTSPCHAHPPAVHAPPPWTEFLTHASENITLPQLRCGR